MYQAQFVPQENREIEYRHFQEAQSDMVEVRSSITTAGQADVSQYPTVELGTNYPARTVAVNPAAPAGTLRTSDAYAIQVTNETGAAPTNVSTRFLEYRNGYNRMDIGPIWYEHSVLYLDERADGGNIAVYEDQNIVQENTSTRLTALQNEIHQTSTGRVTVELYPTENASINSSSWSGNVTLTIPTRLNDTEYWSDELGDFEGYNGVEENAVADGVHYLNLTVGAESLRFNTVGIEAAPREAGTVRQGIGITPQQPTEDETQPTPDTPAFESLAVEVSKSAGDSGNIKQLEASGSITNPDTNGDVQMQLFTDSAGSSPHGQNEIQMRSPFKITTDASESNQEELYVEIRLLDGNDDAYQSCYSNSPVRDGSPLDISDFDC
ncbi:hypothetical protein DVK02_04195 [Halobellus sp. Atlit-31R]|nr:hypothetical protein DVK02_04195 [Halobellus sp. Atlit-31R]